jgi:predicted ATPase
VLGLVTSDLNEAVPLLADLLSIPAGEHYAPLNLTPQKRKERTLHAQLAQVEGLAARQPVLIVFEDVHWSDPTTRESLDLLVDRVPALRVLVILTLRPELTPPWIGRPHVTLMSLDRLSQPQRANMVVGVTGGKVLPQKIADQIIDRTDGVPLFIEELTKSVVESGLVTKAGDHYSMERQNQSQGLAKIGATSATRCFAGVEYRGGQYFAHKCRLTVGWRCPVLEPRLPPDELSLMEDVMLVHRVR